MPDTFVCSIIYVGKQWFPILFKCVLINCKTVVLRSNVTAVWFRLYEQAGYGCGDRISVYRFLHLKQAPATGFRGKFRKSVCSDFNA